jgi:nucleoside-diphosphate-sugar epimerase
MKHTVTHIFHNSYPLNFNLGMAAFEPQFATVRALIDLAATSSLAVRPRIIFASSVGTLQNWQHPEWVPETKVDTETALGTGYSESKRVCELVGLFEAEFTMVS